MTITPPSVRFGDIMRPNSRPYMLGSEEDANLVGMRLYGGGPFHRELKPALRIAKKSHFVIRAGDVIYNKLFAWKGTFGIVPPTLDGMFVSDKFPTYELDRAAADPDYIRWSFRWPPLWEQAREMSTGSAALSKLTLNPPKFLELKIPLPPLPEQQRIVGRIEEVATKIDEARSLRCDLVAEAQAVLPAVVSKLDGELRAARHSTTLERITHSRKGSLRSGPFGSALLHSEFVSEGVPAVGIQDVQENRFALTRRWNVTPEKAQELSRFQVRPGDVLVTVMGTLGRACVVPEGVPTMVSTKHIWTITLDRTKAEPGWVSYWINFSRYVRDQLLGQGTGTAIAGLNGTKIRSMTFPAIPADEQRRILAHLDSLQAKVDALTKLQAETAGTMGALLPSILDKAFKGEL